MATIEERAKKVFPSCVVHYPSDDIPYNRMQSDRRLGYVKGATEQETITKQEMIDKACEWLAEHFNITLKEFEDGGKFVEQLFTTEVEDAFRKAMEE